MCILDRYTYHFNFDYIRFNLLFTRKKIPFYLTSGTYISIINNYLTRIDMVDFFFKFNYYFNFLRISDYLFCKIFLTTYRTYIYILYTHVCVCVYITRT